MVRPIALFLVALALLSQCFAANVPGGGGSGPDVTLQDAGRTVVLSNGLLTATILKDKATVTSLQFKGTEMAKSVYYSMDGGKDFRVPSRCVYAVHAATPEMVDVALTSAWQKEAQAFDIEVHYVLRRGSTGLYSYAVLTHPAEYPDTGHGEWRMVWKLPEDLLEKIYVDDLRHWPMPNSYDLKQAEKTPIKEIVKLTTGVMAGQYDCKYKYAAEYWDLGYWGHASNANKLGGWIVLGSHEFFNDGPTKQDLNASSGINHLYFGMNHYGASTVKVAKGERWQKFYGPHLIYCNSNAAGGDACWSDAREQAKVEHTAWPYAWLKHPSYPAAQERGTVRGQLVVKDELKPRLNSAGAWVGLANPSAGGNWQFESKNYQYWVRAEPNGQFTIPHVRPGTYTLYAFTSGAVGEFSRGEVVVTAGQTNELSEVTWNVPHRGQSIAWEIGVADRTAREFGHGADYFLEYLWQRFGQDFANPLEFTIGQSKVTDWNYAQATYRTDAKSDGKPWPWRVHFKLASVPPGTATLTLAIASADDAAINVQVNGKHAGRVTPSVQGGNALLRQGIHAKYCVEYLEIPTSRLKVGDNVLTLDLRINSSATRHVMYDYVSLELP